MVDHHFRTQHGLVTRAQCLAAGMTPRQIDSLLARGRWIAVHRGVYRLRAWPVTFEQRALAGCLCAGPGAIASHTTAAVLHHLDGVRPGRIEITRTHGGIRDAPGARVHQARHLDPTDVAWCGSIPVTAPARTIVDLAGRLSVPALTEAVDGAICARTVTPESVRAAMDRAGRRPGNAALKQVLGLWADGPLPESVAERKLLRRMLALGFPHPVLQHEIRRNGTFVARVDFAYPDAHIAVEYDGRRRHLDPNHIRANAIRAAGWTLLVATAPDLRARTPFYDDLASLLP